jgi:hypothetical protein
VQTEHKQYFDAIQQHPRLLIGKSVPSINGDGEETLRDSDDAKEWQEAVKTLLVAEVQDRTGRAMEENATYLQTLHQSIEVFQNNADLIPGTKGFDVELANRLTQLLEPYAVKHEEKLHGWSIPVQPIVNQLRTQIAAERAASSAAPAAPAARTSGGGAAKADPPQAGIQSKAGNSSEAEDFSTLFGTIGLPNLKI